MKNRNISHILLGLAVLLLAVSACIEPIQPPMPDGNDNLYSISFQIRTQDDALKTKAGPLSGADALVSSLFMYCFDSNGRYLGRYAATIVTQEQMEYTESREPGQFKGEIPPATARIHFVANADCPVGGDMIGMTEAQVMHAAGLVYRTKSDPISYWGYLRRNSPSDLAILFNGTNTATVWMVRDRARIVAGSYDKNVFYDDISWVVYNGLNNGFIAPYGTTAADGTAHTTDWWDEDNPYQELRHSISATDFSLSSLVTAYPEIGGRFTTEAGDMVPFDKDVTGYQPMYVFDDECPVHTAARVTKIIIKARFKATGSTKYFPLCITHGYDAEPVAILRGHVYQINLKALPEASGYDDFAGAAGATTFANGALVDIPDDVLEVSDGFFNMRVNYTMTYPLSGESYLSTAILLQQTTESVTVPFAVTKQSSSVGDKDFNFSEGAWIPEEEGVTPARAGGNVSWGSGISANKHATIGNLNSTITLPVQPVGSTLKESTFNLKGFYMTQLTEEGITYDVKNILMRNIDVFSIDRFLIQEAYTSSSENHNTVGNLVLISIGDNKYRLKFKLPGGTDATGDHDKYPEILYPLQVKFATRTLLPTNIYINGVEQENAVFGVQVRSTVPNTPPAMLSAQDNATQWNYQSSDNYWNFWYTYPIVSVPRYNGETGEIQTGTIGEEIIGPEIWVDFADVRSSSVFQTVPDNLGLYLYIEYFGAANAVSINAAAPYVAVTGVTINPAAGTSTTGHANNNRYNLNENTTLQLVATVNPSNATNKRVTWASSNSNYATVDQNGLVRAQSVNQNRNVQITATTADGNRQDTFYISVRNN